MLNDILFQEFLQSPEGLKVTSKLSIKGQSQIFLSDITESAKGFFLSSLINSNILNRSIVFLADDSTSAQNLYYEVSNLTKAPVFIFQGSEVSPYDQIHSDVDILSNQTHTLLHLMQKKTPCLIITTLKFISEKVWNKDDLTRNTIVISKDTHTEPKLLSEELISIGYKRVPVVTMRGEFSCRGDIFDVYPVIGSPSRINFFGDEIESIRHYSLSTQRSTDIIHNIIITPRFYCIKPNINELTTKILEYSKEDTSVADLAREEVEKVIADNYCESIESYAPLLNQRNSSLLDFLDKDTLIINNDWEASISLIEKWIERNEKIKTELIQNKKLLPIKYFLLENKEDILKKLKDYSNVFVERFEKFDVENLNTISVNLKPIERFSNQIEKFIESATEWKRKYSKIFIFSEQPQRIHGLLKEWEIPSIFSETAKDSDYENNQIFISSGGTISGFQIPSRNIKILTDQEIFGTKRKVKLLHNKKEAAKDKYQYYTNIEDIKLNDYVVHIKHGIGKYRGLVKIAVDTNEKEYLMVEYASEGKLYLPVEQINTLYRYRGANEVVPKLSKLGGSDWEMTKKKVKKAIKRIAEDLLNLYTARSKLEGYQFNKDSHWQIEMEEAFPYTETPDQWKSIQDMKKDMESTKPMDRLVCGDVGYGKTEVAIRGIFKAVLSNKQVAVLVPTTILAQQHFNTITERLAAYPVRVALLSRFKSNKEQKEAINKLTLGEVDVIIGTHRLLQKDVKFKDLGLVVIDEEQRFGVGHKERLKQLRVTVDVLTLSATPIPRTLYMALSGARDLSTINTAPTNRMPIKTYVGEFKPTIIRTAILHELERGGQIYFLHNRVETIDKTAAYIKELVPEAIIGIAHGQMNPKDLENVMHEFSMRKYNVLVCTTIIESGLDIPNVNTIIIDNADRLGLAQMYQLRGRVGRTDVQAYAYCLYSDGKLLTDVARNRLEAIKEFTSLGSGYQIALRDMEIRGVGNILGAEQHGHMVSIGFDLYCKLLNEAVDKLKGIDTGDVELDTEVDINISAYIPNEYISDENQKVLEYKRLAGVKNKHEIEFLESEWKDRFGELPEEVNHLLRIVELRILASKIGIKTIKSEVGSQYKNIKISVDLRLQEWIKLQKLLPKKLFDRTSLKALARGADGPSSNIYFKTLGLNTGEIIDYLFDLLYFLQNHQLNEKIA